MSLKQYSPHLQLTIRKPIRLVLGSRLLSAWLLAMLVLIELKPFLLLLACVGVLLLPLLIQRSFVSAQSTVTMNEYVLAWGDRQYPLQGLQVLFSYVVLIVLHNSKAPLLLSRDQLDDQSWQRLMRYIKLQT